MGQHKSNTIIRIHPDVYEELEHIRQMTRRPVSEIATEALRYAIEHSHLVNAQVYDVVFGDINGKVEKNCRADLRQRVTGSGQPK